MKYLARLRSLVVHQILHLDDTPHRIALGVALGTWVSLTPTVGVQFAIYLVVATLFRANRVSGIPPLYITNPVTAVPVYLVLWKFGHAIVHAGDVANPAQTSDVAHMLSALVKQAQADFSSLFTAAFWRETWQVISPLGVELWVGGLVAGALLAVPSYVLTLWLVRWVHRIAEVYREHHGHDLHRKPKSDPPSRLPGV